MKIGKQNINLKAERFLQMKRKILLGLVFLILAVCAVIMFTRSASSAKKYSKSEISAMNSEELYEKLLSVGLEVPDAFQDYEDIAEFTKSIVMDVMETLEAQGEFLCPFSAPESVDLYNSVRETLPKILRM